MHMHDLAIIERRFQATTALSALEKPRRHGCTDSRLIVNIGDKPLSVEVVGSPVPWI